MRSILILIVSFVASYSLFAKALEDKLPHLGSDKIDVQKYSLRLDIAELNQSFNAQLKIRLKTLKSLNDFGLHLDAKRLTIISVKGAMVDSYKIIQGIKGNHGLEGKVLKVSLNQKMMKNQSLEVTLSLIHI